MAHRAQTEDLRTFGSLVVNARVARGLTSLELSKKIGFSQSTLSRIEAGQREPRLEIMRRVVKILPEIRDAIIEYIDTGVFGEVGKVAGK